MKHIKELAAKVRDQQNGGWVEEPLVRLLAAIDAMPDEALVKMFSDEEAVRQAHRSRLEERAIRLAAETAARELWAALDACRPWAGIRQPDVEATSAYRAASTALARHAAYGGGK